VYNLYKIGLSIVSNHANEWVSTTLWPPKNDTDIGRYYLDVRQPMLTILGRNVVGNISGVNCQNRLVHVNAITSDSVAVGTQHHTTRSEPILRIFLNNTHTDGEREPITRVWGADLEPPAGVQGAEPPVGGQGGEAPEADEVLCLKH